MGTHPIFESDFDCLTEQMTNTELLPIYDDESKKLVPAAQPEIVSIHEVAARARYRLIDGPIKCAKAHICKYARKSYDHLTSTNGMLQVSSLTIGGIVGSKLASRALPRLKSKTYTSPYIAAHRTVMLSVPWAVSCYWFQTPLDITQFIGTAIKTTISWSAWLVWQPIYWLIVWPPCALVYYTLYGLYSLLALGGGKIYSAIKAQFEAKEVVEVPAIQEEKVEEVTEEKPAVQEEILNESTAEAELKKLKRHGNEEEVIRIEKNDGDNPELVLEEDHGQADADDKDLYERGR